MSSVSWSAAYTTRLPSGLKRMGVGKTLPPGTSEPFSLRAGSLPSIGAPQISHTSCVLEATTTRSAERMR